MAEKDYKALDVFQTGYFPPFPAGSTKGNFSNFHYENLIGFLEVTLTKV